MGGADPLLIEGDSGERMGPSGVPLLACLLLAVSAMAGCATASGQGQAALRQGRYDEAAGHFQQALAQNPLHPEALTGLGISRYKLGAFDEAVDALGRVAAQAPEQREARLYLGLSHLRRGDLGLAEEQLAALAALKPHPRLAAQIDQSLRLLRTEYPVSDELLGFIAASLEHELEWEREVREAQHVRPAYLGPFRDFGFARCIRNRLGRLVCW